MSSDRIRVAVSKLLASTWGRSNSVAVQDCWTSRRCDFGSPDWEAGGGALTSWFDVAGFWRGSTLHLTAEI